MEFRTVHTEEEQSQAMALSSLIFNKNMAKKFLLLFGKENWKHMFIAISNGCIVSMVNYYTTLVEIGEISISLASIGSVCTHPDYRNQKLASKLLSMAIDTMKAERVDLMVISGAGGIYSQAHATYAGNAYEFIINEEDLPQNQDITIEKTAHDDYHRLIPLYQKETVRYHRTDDEFSALLKGQTDPDDDMSYPIILIKKQHIDEGYIVGMVPKEKNEFGIKEWAGNRQSIVYSLKSILDQYQKNQIHFACDSHDALVSIVSEYSHRLIHQYASFKIINFKALMDHLQPYFKQVFPRYTVEFLELNETYTIIINQESFKIESIEQMTQLVLGNPDNEPLNLSAVPLIESFVSLAFPIPFVWTHNLNYQ